MTNQVTILKYDNRKYYLPAKARSQALSNSLTEKARTLLSKPGYVSQGDILELVKNGIRVHIDKRLDYIYGGGTKDVTAEVLARIHFSEKQKAFLQLSLDEIHNQIQAS